MVSSGSLNGATTLFATVLPGVPEKKVTDLIRASGKKLARINQK